MNTSSRRIARWLAGCVTITLIVLFSLNFILTQAVTSETLKKRLIEEICGPFGCQLAFDKLEVVLLPAPHVAASRVEIALPGMLSGTVETLSLVPRLLPLLSGRIELAEVHFIAPRMTVTLPEASAALPSPEALPPKSDASSSPLPPPRNSQEPPSGVQESEPSHQDSSRIAQGEPLRLSPMDLEARLFSALRALSEKVAGVRLRVERGSFDIVSGKWPSLSLREFSTQVALLPSVLALSLECQSNLWNKLSAEGWVDPRGANITGHLRVAQFRTQLPGEYLPAGTLKPVGDSPLDLEISFSNLDSGRFQMAFQASSPSLTLQMGEQRAVISNSALEGMLHMAADQFEITVARLHIEDPQLELTGRFWSHPQSPEAAYQLTCRNTNATALREVALALVGNSEVVQDVFTFVKGGHIPLATFEARGRSVSELKEGHRLEVKGRMEQGEVFIPSIALQISEVFGDVAISQGILEGRNLQGKADRSVGRQGSLVVGLEGKDGPFHLDIEIDADLAQLPPVLARVVDNQAFLRELALARDVSGVASGRLVLGDTRQRIKTRVEVGEWKLQGSYERFPFPIEIEARALVYEGTELAVETLQSRFGRSEVQDFSGSLSWSKKPSLELTSPAKGRIVLDELFPWLLTFSPVRDNRWGIQTLAGILQMESLLFKGPLAKPGNWQFALSGLLHDATVDSSLLGDPIKISSGALSWTPEQFASEKSQLTFLDTSLAVSGKFDDLGAERPPADFTFQGSLGPQTLSWLSDLVSLPSELRLRAPLALLPSRFTFDHTGHSTLAGTFRTETGAEVSFALGRGDQEVSVRQIKIDDQESNALITLKLTPEEAAFAFQGNLGGGTLDRILAANRFFKGSMTGNCSVQLVKGRLADSKAEGKLALRDFYYPPVPGKALRVEEASLEAGEHGVKLKSASIRLQDEFLKLTGTVSTNRDHLVLDMDLAARGLDWQQLQEIELLKNLNETALGQTTPTGITLAGISIAGTVRLQADHFACAGYLWKPFRAALVFGPDGLNFEVTKADLCSIATPAKLIAHPQSSLLIVTPAGRNLDLDNTLACLWNRKGFITGAFDLAGEITARVQPEKMAETLRGNLNLQARDGRVYHSPVLSKIFTLLNVTEIYRGQLPDLTQEGCAYDSIKATAVLKNGKVLVEDAVFDGHCAKMVWTGAIDLATLNVDFTVLVSPFKTIDTFIRNVPLLGTFLGGTLITIPVQVSGAISNPNVTPLSPTAVGSGLLNTMKKVLQLPFTLQQPLQ